MRALGSVFDDQGHGGGLDVPLPASVPPAPVDDTAATVAHFDQAGAHTSLGVASWVRSTTPKKLFQ